mgnify:CR=1 FL=1
MPYLGSTVFVTLAIGTLVLALTAALVLASAVFAERREKAATALAAYPKASIALGGLISLVSVALLGALLQSPISRPLGMIASATALALLCVGLSAVAVLVERRLVGQERAESPGEHEGALTLLLSSLLPLVGWFLVLPLSLFGGVGAVALSVLRVGERSKEPAAARPVPMAEAYAAPAVTTVVSPPRTHW